MYVHVHTHTHTHTQVISACFSYLELIKKEGVPQYVLDEVQQLSEVFFKYKEAEDAGKVIRLAGNMHRYPEAKDWVAGPALLRDLKMDAVNSLLAKVVCVCVCVCVCLFVCGCVRSGLFLYVSVLYVSFCTYFLHT